MTVQHSAFGSLHLTNLHLMVIGLSAMMSACFENPDRPSLTTLPIEIISGQGFFTGGIITSDGGSDVIEKGICVGNEPNLSIATGKVVIVGDAFGTTVPIIQGKTFYVRAYAINGAGIGYGNELIFSSVIVYLQYLGEITGNSAMCTVVVQSDQQVTSRGVCWSTSDPPTISDSKVEAGSGTGNFNVKITGLANGTRYYVRPYAVGLSGVFYGSTTPINTASKPTLTTQEINNRDTFIPNTGGIITDIGGLPVIKAGVCWSTHTTPTLDDSKTEMTNVYGTIFNSELTGLQPSTTYYVRAYATNAVGTAYGNELMVTTPAVAMTDADGNVYSSVTIGSQVWTVENLKTTHYSNGDEISHITNHSEWINTNSGAWDYYASDVSFAQPYGKLYNWFAVTDTRNICSTGWHEPSDTEWSTLVNFLGGIDAASVKLQEAGSIHWSLRGSGTNSSGFTGLPGGSVSPNGYSNPLGISGLFWTTTASDAASAWSYHLTSNLNAVIHSPYEVRFGLSVRCVKD